jgi:hypothetical protein
MEIKITINERLVGNKRRTFNRGVLLFLLGVVLAGVAVVLPANPIVIPNVFNSGEVISSSQMNANFSLLENKVNEIDGLVGSLSAGVAMWSLNDPHIYYNDGNVGIGTNTPTSLLSLFSATSAGIEIGSGDVSVDPYIIFDVANDDAVKLWRDSGSLKFNTGGSPQMIIEAGGDVGIGTSTPAEKLHIYDGNLFIQGGELKIDESSGYPFHIYSQGEDLYITQYISAGADLHLVNTYNDDFDLFVEDRVTAKEFTTTSDARLKEDIAPITGALDRLAAVDGVSFRFLGAEEPRLGLVAQNVMQSVPEAVSVCDGESGYLGVDYQAMIPLLIEAVKELKAQNDLLLDRITALEGR